MVKKIKKYGPQTPNFGHMSVAFYRKLFNHARYLHSVKSSFSTESIFIQAKHAKITPAPTLSTDIWNGLVVPD